MTNEIKLPPIPLAYQAVYEIGKDMRDYATQAILKDRAQRDAEIERMQADAARYQWLRKTTNYATSNGEKVDVRNFPELWDASIDSMIAKTPKEQP